MDTFIGLLGIGAWIVVVIGVAAAITWTVIKISPTKTEHSDSPQP